jgi:hypothetical protein
VPSDVASGATSRRRETRSSLMGAVTAMRLRVPQIAAEPQRAGSQTAEVTKRVDEPINDSAPPL